MKLIDELVYEYLHARQSAGGLADLIGWWRWARDNHATLYPLLVKRIKVDDPDVDRVRRSLIDAELRSLPLADGPA